MPSPATPHRASNRGGDPSTPSNKSAPAAKQKPLDIGKPLGLYDTNSVRSKVRKWQYQGGGVVIANEDIYYDEDEENSTVISEVKSIGKDKESHSSRARSSSTPRKRVISDEHWKLNRYSGQASQTPPPKLAQPKRVAEYTTNDGLESSRSDRGDVRKHERSRPPPASRSRDRSRAGATESARREHRKSKSSRDLDAKVDVQSDTAPRQERPTSSASRPVTATKSLPEDRSEVSERSRTKSLPPDGDVEWAASEADFSELSKKRARGPEVNAVKSAHLKPQPPKGGIFTHMLGESKKIFVKPEPPKPRGSKIDAWLSGTPDPFVNESEPDVDIPAPLNTRLNKPKRPTRREEDHDRAMDPEPSPGGQSRHGNGRGRRMKSKGPIAGEEKPTEDKPILREREYTPSPSGRKRSNENKQDKSPLGSKESEAPDKVSEENMEANETESHPFSEGSEVSNDDRSISLGRNRPFPKTGSHRLSTIASSESMSAHDPGKTREPTQGVTSEKENSTPTQEAADSEERDQFDPNSLPMVTSQLRRRLTTHDDLISVLSSSNTRSRSLRSARSLRSNKSRATTATVGDLLKELSADEAKYMRELKTLVGGVIPVLLTCVLSRSDSAVAAGLFHPSIDPKDEMNFTRPIVDMGVAIERLKTLHKRIPQDQADSLLNWATGAQKVYRDYLKAWRLGFKDVIVNLAPLDEAEAAKDKNNNDNDNSNNNSDTKSLDEGMARDENGDIVDSEGEKVDVAYLLKRPLVRLKYLSKTFKGLNMLQPSPKAEEVAGSYQILVTEARRRAREERARLEDESAASIDSTRARDPATLGALTGVTVDQTRRVRARDFFNFSLYHSSGQVIDCRTELLMRDNIPMNGAGGDILICEVDHSDRWLLFPPVDIGCVSARTGDKKGEIVVMLRSPPGWAKPWKEVISLQIDEEEIAFEWVQLMGLHPVPPAISRSQSFLDRARQRQRQLQQQEQQKQQEQQEEQLEQDAPCDDDLSTIPETPPSPSNLDVPIGEKATSRAARRSLTPKELSMDPSTVESSSAVESRLSLYTAITADSDCLAGESVVSGKSASQPSILHARDPRGATPVDDKMSPGLKRSKAKRVSRYGDISSTGSSPTKESVPEEKAPPSTPRKDQGDIIKQSAPSPAPARETKSAKEPQRSPPRTPTKNNSDKPSPRLSSVPSVNLPSIPKIRPESSYTHVSEELGSPSDEDNISLDYSELPDSPTKRKSHARSNSDSSQPVDDDERDGDAPPPPPPHRSPSSSTGSSLSNTPVLSPTTGQQRRRGSSPLKHEYEPSAASDSFSDSDTSTVRRYDVDSGSEYSVSDSSEEGESDDELASSLLPVEDQEPPKPTQQASIVPSGSSLSPSHSASQGGYRSVPSQPTKSTRTMASIFAWSDRGTWESLLSDECVIIVNPGLIEAYEMSVAPPESNNGDSKGRPMIALELTPLVPIRRGTAIDISIRSPPTDRSKVTWSNNIMFRSRNADECEVLYGLINNSRINNPTYIALQNARGPFADQPVPLEHSNKSAGGWFGWPRRRKSYRASPSSPRSLADNSDSSVGTMSSAFSALKRFGNGSKMFNLSRSTVTSRNGQREDSLHSSSAASGSTSGIGRIAAAIKGVDGIGLSNAKIRLYTRETQTKWRDMGAARLTIMPAPRDPALPESSVSENSNALPRPPTANGASPPRPPTASSSNPRRGGMELEKRILIRGKTRNEVLLDVCLGESSFERVARTGIAVSVWEENAGGAMPEKGGVTSGTYKIYMVQMKSEAEAAYTFGLVGKLRY